MSIFYFLSVFIFISAMIGILLKRNILSVIVCIELMLSSITLLFVLTGAQQNNISGHVFATVLLFLGLIQMVVGLYITVYYFNTKKSTQVDELN